MVKESLKKFAYLSIAAAILTIGLKFGAYFLTGSMGLFSDALESCVSAFLKDRLIKIMNLGIQKPNIFQVPLKVR
ncbi:MAG: Cation efflux protein (Precursor) [Bacteroidetes bacterium]|nr:Cation efflux protein (Precursor) [Bacteroidota bacterium]